ncbi:MAG TPA: di-trans,poly-cis-decaprenylcistransferase [Pirellulales bacterium]|nr:di-trans,poly-cis-decaprenylcistransferase [Pirellulales bacterium]
MQSSCSRKSLRHIAIIMDGNGRWAQRRGAPRTDGHQAGGEAVRRVVEAAPDLGIGTLTLFAFAAANWQRPASEVAALMKLFHEYLVNETELCCRKGVRLSLVGRRDRLPPSLRTTIAAAEQVTRPGGTLHLRLAIDYSSRESIVAAARRMAATRGCGEISIEDFSRLVAADRGVDDDVPEVDLVIRTGGERRLSDFLLWESAFAELYFTDRMWPEFTADDLAAAVADFERRDRRFGRISTESLAPAL